MTYNYVVGADQDFGGVDVSREEMVRWFGEARVIAWEIMASRKRNHGHVANGGRVLITR